MRRYIIRRLILMVVTIWVVVSIIFFLFRLMPSEPTALIIGPALRPEAQNALREAWGLDRPLHVQYLVFWKNLLKGEFGIFIDDRADDAQAKALPAIFGGRAGGELVTAVGVIAVEWLVLLMLYRRKIFFKA